MVEQRVGAVIDIGNRVREFILNGGDFPQDAGAHLESVRSTYFLIFREEIFEQKSRQYKRMERVGRWLDRKTIEEVGGDLEIQLALNEDTKRSSKGGMRQARGKNLFAQ